MTALVRGSRAGQIMARGVTRPSNLYGRNGRLGVSKSTFYENVVHHDDSDPFIPGTEVPRLKLAHIGPKIAVAFNDELDALEEALRRERDRKLRITHRTPTEDITV